jgi:hypothetical protein
VNSIVMRTSSGGTVRCPALPTPVPGLCVARYEQSFPVVHSRSGTTLGVYDSPEAALGAAIDLGKYHDWTLCATTLRERPASVHYRIVETCNRWLGLMASPPAPLDLDDLQAEGSLDDL